MDLISPRQRFFSVFEKNLPFDRPPVWFMRQAGRYLPEYRALRERYGFLELVKTPELAAEVTLQPLKRFALDAAIIFSDILVIPEALGQTYAFGDQGGIQMDWTLSGPSDLRKLRPANTVAGHLDYVAQALMQVRQALPHTALLGFGGSPWTLATYMVEGGSSRHFLKIKDFYFSHPAAFEALMERLTEALIDYFKLQIKAGVDALQIFDTWGSLCPANHYWKASLQWIARIVTALKQSHPQTPILLYTKHMAHHVALQVQTGAHGLSVDESTSMADLRLHVPSGYVLQGNLDPSLLCTTASIAYAETKALLSSLQAHGGLRNTILNLGHGMLPSARIECIEAMLQALGEEGVKAKGDLSPLGSPFR